MYQVVTNAVYGMLLIKAVYTIDTIWKGLTGGCKLNFSFHHCIDLS
jgi:hypothetical protein